MPQVIIDIAGWGGVILLLAAYALVSTKRVEGDSLPYQFLNIAGAALVIVNSFHYGAYPSVGINVAWIAVAVYAVAKRRL